MAKALLVYYSGTGNTAIAAKFLQKHLMERGYDVDLYFAQKPYRLLPDLSRYDLLGFGYPIHAFNTPLNFLKFLKKFPRGHQPYFIFRVSGEPFRPNCCSSHPIYRILKRKGYQYRLDKHFLMPYDIVFRYKDSLAKQMYLYLDALTEAYAEKITRGIKEKPHNPLDVLLWSILLRIEWIAGPVNCKLVHVKKKKCLRCDGCIRGCPAHALYRNKKGVIRVHPSCNICMHCVMNCPSDAFVFGFLNPWKVVGNYPYEKLVANPGIDAHYVNPQTKGYFRHFRKYFLAQDAFLKEYGVPIPK